MSVYCFQILSESAYRDLLQCINNTGMHRSGSRKGSAILWKKLYLQSGQEKFMYFLNPVLDNQGFFERKWLLLGITGYFTPSTSLAIIHFHTRQLELTDSITNALKVIP